MKYNKLLSYLTIALFLLLIGGFVAFRTGRFDSYIAQKQEDTIGPIRKVNDSIKPKTGSAKLKLQDTVRRSPTMLSTSKSIVTMDQTILFPKRDTLLVAPKKNKD